MGRYGFSIRQPRRFGTPRPCDILGVTGLCRHTGTRPARPRRTPCPNIAGFARMCRPRASDASGGSGPVGVADQPDRFDAMGVAVVARQHPHHMAARIQPARKKRRQNAEPAARQGTWERAAMRGSGMDMDGVVGRTSGMHHGEQLARPGRRLELDAGSIQCPQQNDQVTTAVHAVDVAETLPVEMPVPQVAPAGRLEPDAKALCGQEQLEVVLPVRALKRAEATTTPGSWGRTPGRSSPRTGRRPRNRAARRTAGPGATSSR